MEKHFPVTKCRLCGSSRLTGILDLGSQAIANHFYEPGHEKEVESAPLRLVRCDACGLVQLGDRIDTDIMYRNYWYQSGINRTMRDHLDVLAKQAMSLVRLEKDDVVVDIGCNDGTFLACLPECVKVGVDPSNIESKGCIRIHDYFYRESVGKVLGERHARLVTSIAMFYDLNDPRDFVRNVTEVLADDGMWILELSYLPKMLQNNAYDSICHEHVTYYSLASFAKVLEGSGLEMFDVEMNEMNGSSFRPFVARQGSHPQTERLCRAVEEEKQVLTDALFSRFVLNVRTASTALREFLSLAHQAGKSVYGYGASTKGQVVMQYCGLTPDHLSAIAERNPRKYNLLTPGSGVAICSEQAMREAKPDYLLIFPWYFLDEFVTREQDLLVGGTKMVVPLPFFRILEAGY